MWQRVSPLADKKNSDSSRNHKHLQIIILGDSNDTISLEYSENKENASYELLSPTSNQFLHVFFVRDMFGKRLIKRGT